MPIISTFQLWIFLTENIDIQALIRVEYHIQLFSTYSTYEKQTLWFVLKIIKITIPIQHLLAMVYGLLF